MHEQQVMCTRWAIKYIIKANSASPMECMANCPGGALPDPEFANRTNAQPAMNYTL
jgi:hypothetical protein